MPFGPIVSRELLVAARTRQTYSGRVLITFGFIACFYGIYEGYRSYYGPSLTIQQIATLVRQTFLMLVAVQGIATLTIVPQFVCGAIAREKDGKTLGFLLGTPLESAEIILGKLASRLFRYFATMASLIPMAMLLTFLGGVEPAEVLLLTLATVSTAITLGSFAILASTLCRATKQATGCTSIFIAVWVFLPFLIGVVGRFVSPGLYRRVALVNDWVLSSSPLFFANQVLPMIFGRRPTSWSTDIAWMVGLQLGLSTFFLLLAIWRLRPAYRDQEGNSGRTILERIRKWRWRLFRRPPVSDNPVLWRERYKSSTSGLAKLFAVVVITGLLGLLVYFTATFALATFGIELPGHHFRTLEQAQLHFSLYIRVVSSAIAAIMLIILCSMTSTSIASEKERETWLGLLATPLSGREILRSKWLGNLLQIRPLVVTVLLLWLVALFCRSIHPIGFLLGLAVVSSWAWLAIGLGSWFSTRCELSGNASGSAVGLYIMIWLIPPLLNSYEPFRSIWNVATCFPYLLWMALISNHNVEMISQRFSNGPIDLGLIGASTWVDALMVVIVGITLPSIAGTILVWHANRTFDRLAGRPIRRIRH